METGVTGNRRYNRVGSSSLQARVSDRRATEIAPAEAAAPGGSDNRGAFQEREDDGDRPDERRSALAAETQLALLASVHGTGEAQTSSTASLVPARVYQRAEAEAGDASSVVTPHKVSRTI